MVDSKKLSNSNEDLPTSIFRKQALDSLAQPHHGQIVDAQAIGFGTLTLLFASIAVAVLLFVFFATTTRTLDVVGVLVPDKGLVRIAAQQAGVILKKNIAEGQKVKVGDVFFVISNEPYSLQDQEKTSALLKARKKNLQLDLDQRHIQAEQTNKNDKNKIVRFESDKASSLIELDIQKQRVKLAHQVFDRYTQLYESGFISILQFQDKKLQLLESVKSQTEIERTISTIEREILMIQAAISKNNEQFQLDKSKISRDMFELDQLIIESEFHKNSTVRSPQEGTVFGMNTDVGESVHVNQTLVSIIPESSQLEAEVYLPSKEMGSIRIGMPVEIRLQAFPYQKFGQLHAIIREISSVPTHLEDIPQKDIYLKYKHGESLHKLKLTVKNQNTNINGVKISLKPGMIFDSSISLEKRRLFEWIFYSAYNFDDKAH